MDWNSDSNKFIFSATEFDLVANPSELKEGIDVSKRNESFVRLLEIKDKEFVEVGDATYTRGSDIFTVFEKANHTAECYWRLVDEIADTIVLESIVSLRSSHLETEPFQFELVNCLAGENEFKFIDDRTVFFAGDQTSVLFLIHPDDANEVHFSSQQNELTTTISVPLLERGVIRRVRSRACLFGSKITESQIEDLRRRFEKSEIPLTT